MSKKDHPSQTQEIIQTLAERERELERSIQEARAQAAGMLEQAKQQARDIISQAESQVAEEARVHQQRLVEKITRLRQDAKDQAKQRALALEGMAEQKKDRAVALVLKTVLPLEER